MVEPPIPETGAAYRRQLLGRDVTVGDFREIPHRYVLNEATDRCLGCEQRESASIHQPYHRDTLARQNAIRLAAARARFDARGR